MIAIVLEFDKQKHKAIFNKVVNRNQTLLTLLAPY